MYNKELDFLTSLSSPWLAICNVCKLAFCLLPSWTRRGQAITARNELMKLLLSSKQKATPCCMSATVVVELKLCCLLYHGPCTCMLQRCKTTYSCLWPSNVWSSQWCMLVTHVCHSSKLIMICISRMLPEYDRDQAKVTSVYRRRYLTSHEQKVCRHTNTQRSANKEIWLHARWLLKIY